MMNKNLYSHDWFPLFPSIYKCIVRFFKSTNSSNFIGRLYFYYRRIIEFYVQRWIFAKLILPKDLVVFVRDVETGKDNVVATIVYNVIYVAGRSFYGDIGIVTL